MIDITRRTFFELSTSGLVVASAAIRVNAAPQLSANPFTLGVASGDPLPDRVVVWTRLALAPLELGGGMPPETLSVRWELALDEQYGRVEWGVRAIWEGYAGWFRYESTTELYAVPPASVHPEVVALAGGPAALAQAAQKHVASGQPLEALHLVDMALAAEPANRAALLAKQAALKLLLEQRGPQNFQEAGWLRATLRQTEAALGP